MFCLRINKANKTAWDKLKLALSPNVGRETQKFVYSKSLADKPASSGPKIKYRLSEFVDEAKSGSIFFKKNFKYRKIKKYDRYNI